MRNEREDQLREKSCITYHFVQRDYTSQRNDSDTVVGSGFGSGFGSGDGKHNG